MSGISRWQRGLLGVGIVGVFALGAVMLIRFAAPTDDDLRHRPLDLGSVDRFAAGSVTTFVIYEDRFEQAAAGEVVGTSSDSITSCPRMHVVVVHLVRFEDGSFSALSARSSHLGEMVPWLSDFTFEGTSGWFREPCHGDTYATDGTRVFGPAPRGLDRYATVIEDERVVLDLGDLTEGTRSSSRKVPTPTPAMPPN